MRESPEAFGGYWRRPDADARTIRASWYFPGDLAVADEDGDLWVSGRVDDMIVSGGENIDPGDIEDAVAGCPAVADVVVAGTPDDRWGHAVTAFIVPHAGLSPGRALTDADAYIRDRSGLPPLKRPKRLVAIDRIPTSAVGKILRRELTAGTFTALAEFRFGEPAGPEEAPPGTAPPGTAPPGTAPAGTAQPGGAPFATDGRP